MTYSEKLRDPRWQRKRLEIMKRDDFACMNCKSKDKTLVVHHRVYINGREPWEYENHSLETLCEECHNRIHSQHEINKWAYALTGLLCKGTTGRKIAITMSCCCSGFHHMLQLSDSSLAPNDFHEPNEERNRIYLKHLVWYKKAAEFLDILIKDVERRLQP
jgi:hypothetical protein